MNSCFSLLLPPAASIGSDAAMLRSRAIRHYTHLGWVGHSGVVLFGFSVGHEGRLPLLPEVRKMDEHEGLIPSDCVSYRYDDFRDRYEETL